MNCFWGHNFDKWKEIGRGDLVAHDNPDGTERTAGFWIKQERECIDCGYKELDIKKRL